MLSKTALTTYSKHRHTLKGLSHFQNQNCQFLTLAGLADLVHMVGYSTLGAAAEQGNHEMGLSFNKIKRNVEKAFHLLNLASFHGLWRVPSERGVA